MKETLDTIFGILDVVLLDKYVEKFVNYLTITVSHNIEYVDPIEILLIPKKIYITTENIPSEDNNEYREIITRFSCLLIQGITERYTKKDIKIRTYSNMGMYEKTDTFGSLNSTRLMLTSETNDCVISLDIPPELTIELVISKYNIKNDIDKEVVSVKLNI